MSVSLYHDNFYAMGTRFEVLFCGVPTAVARPVYNEIRHEVQQLESDLSHYDDTSPVSAVNRNAGVKPVPVPGQVISVLRRCRSHRRRTEGLFDIVDRFSSDGGALRPNSRESPALRLSDAEGTAFLRDKEARIDLGGLGKGLALERVEHLLDTHEINHALVSFGESSILARGHHPHGNVWKVGISHMTQREKSVCSFEITGDALSTSGNTPRNEGHLRRPRTGRSKQGYETVSVHTESPVEAEVLSTALLLANRTEVQDILETYTPIRAVRIAYDSSGTRPKITELRPPILS